MKKIVAVLMGGCGLTGCAFLTPPYEQPIIEQHAQGRINTFGVIPSRRMMIVKSDGPGTPILICAEAPADVTDNLASTLAASLSASTKAGDAAAGVSKTLETVGQNLFKRSQGVQLFRDRAYHLCQARMNNFISNEQYQAGMNDAFEKTIGLIEKELAQGPREPSTGSASAPKGITAQDVKAQAGSASASIEKGRVESKVEGTRRTQ